MAANTAVVMQSFRKELLNASHAFGSPAANGGRTSVRDTMAIALYRNSSGIGPATTAYATTGEVTSSGFTAGGATCATTDPTTSTNTGYWTPGANISWTNVTMTGTNATDLAMLYNSSSTGKLAIATFALGVIDTGQAPSLGTFTLTMPTNNDTLALIRIT